MSNAAEIQRLSKEMRSLSKKKQTAEKRRKGVNSAKDGLADLSESGFNKYYTEAVSSLKKGLKPLSGSLDAELPGVKSESEYLSNEAYNLTRQISKYEAEIIDLNYRIKNLQIEEG